MELLLRRQAGTQILVTCSDQLSHILLIVNLFYWERGIFPLNDLVGYYQSLYLALFPPETLAKQPSMQRQSVFSSSQLILKLMPSLGSMPMRRTVLFPWNGFLYVVCQ